MRTQRFGEWNTLCEHKTRRAQHYETIKQQLRRKCYAKHVSRFKQQKTEPKKSVHQKWQKEMMQNGQLRQKQSSKKLELKRKSEYRIVDEMQKGLFEICGNGNSNVQCEECRIKNVNSIPASMYRVYLNGNRLCLPNRIASVVVTIICRTCIKSNRLTYTQNHYKIE